MRDEWYEVRISELMIIQRQIEWSNWSPEIKMKKIRCQIFYATMTSSVDLFHTQSPVLTLTLTLNINQCATHTLWYYNSHHAALLQFSSNSVQ